MKRSILWCVLTMSCGFTYGQVNIGLRGGLNLSTIFSVASAPGYNSVSTATDWATNYHAGVFVDIQIIKKISIRPEAIYSVQGGKDSGVGLKLNYLNLPVLFFFHPTPGFSLHAGPQLGILLSTEFGSQTVSNNLFNPVDFGLCAGLGFNVSRDVSLTARYNLGLTSIVEVDYSGAPSGTYASVTNQVVQFSINVRLTKNGDDN